MALCQVPYSLTAQCFLALFKRICQAHLDHAHPMIANAREAKHSIYFTEGLKIMMYDDGTILYGKADYAEKLWVT